MKSTMIEGLSDTLYDCADAKEQVYALLRYMVEELECPWDGASVGDAYTDIKEAYLARKAAE